MCNDNNNESIKFNCYKKLWDDTEYGTIKDDEHVIFSIAPPEGKKEQKAKTFEIKIGKTFTMDGVELNDLGKDSFVLAQKNFDDMVVSSHLVDNLINNVAALHDAEDDVAIFQCTKLNDPADFDADDQALLDDAESRVASAKKLIKTAVEKLFTHHAKFVEIKKNKFEAKVITTCHKPVEHVVSVIRRGIML